MKRKMKRLFPYIVLIVIAVLLGGCTNHNPASTDAISDENAEDITQENNEDASESDDTVTDEPVDEKEENSNLTESEKKALEAQEILAAHSKKKLTYAPLMDPEDQYNLNIVKNIHMIAVETGEYSINQTKTNYGIGGTDLGISFNKDDKTFIAFGDTFKHECFVDGWRSNVLAVTTDKDYTDGILFDSMVTRSGLKTAKELIRSKKIDNVEMTTIPTGGIAIGDALYLSYMSVKHWGAPGEWECNFGSVAKSVDDGMNWEVMETMKWPGDSSFCQMAPVIIDDYVYVLGITGGRRGAAKLMRVPIDQYENFDAYEYLMGYDEAGNPLFEKGTDAMYQGYQILQKPVGEMSVMYSEYLEEWIVTYIDGQANLVMRSAKNIYGPYSNAVIIAAQKDFPTLYGAFMNPKWVSEDGKKIAFLMSLYDPVYNVVLMECELER